MKKQKPQAKDKPAQPGPKPDMLKIDCNWEEAVKKSLEEMKGAGQLRGIPVVVAK